MTSGRRRITLQEKRGFFGRLASVIRRRPPKPVEVAPALGVDFRLRTRAALAAVRQFTEQIHTYQLHSRRCVHVLSRYRFPGDSGLQEKVPEWIAERVRFGLVRGGGDFDYAEIVVVDIGWDEDGTELFLHLRNKVEPGTRAFVAAYLGKDELRATPEVPGLVGRGN